MRLAFSYTNSIISVLCGNRAILIKLLQDQYLPEILGVFLYLYVKVDDRYLMTVFCYLEVTYQLK